MNIQSFLSFLGVFLRSPKDEAALKLAGDISAVVEDWIKDPRIPGIEADVEAFLKLSAQGKAIAPTVAPAERSIAPAEHVGGHPSGTDRGEI